MARIKTPLCERLGLDVPVIQAPMAGGPASPELVTACSAAGALGSFGFAYTPPEEMKKQAAAVRAKTDRPFGINLFGAPLPADIADEAQREALGAVAAYYAELGLPTPDPVRAPYGPEMVTEKFSGKPARGIANRFMREMQSRKALQLAFPAQNSVTAKLRAASAKAGNPDFVAMWAGQGLAMSRALPAAELIACLEAETLEALRRTAGLVKE